MRPGGRARTSRSFRVDYDGLPAAGWPPRPNGRPVQGLPSAKIGKVPLLHAVMRLRCHGDEAGVSPITSSRRQLCAASRPISDLERSPNTA